MQCYLEDKLAVIYCMAKLIQNIYHAEWKLAQVYKCGISRKNQTLWQSCLRVVFANFRSTARKISSMYLLHLPNEVRTHCVCNGVCNVLANHYPMRRKAQIRHKAKNIEGPTHRRNFFFDYFHIHCSFAR